MNASNDRPRRSRATKNSFTTKSGTTIKLHQSLGERLKSSRDARLRRRANRLATLPKGRFKRLLYRLQPKRLWHYWFSRDGAIMALKLLGIGIVAGFILVIGLFAYFRKDLPQLTNISGGNLGGSITYYDRTGQTVLWQDYDAVKRIPVTSDNISKYMGEATVAIEDKNFYKHGAFDIRSIVRAGLHDVFNKSGGTQGASTISEQVVKLNENWTTNRNIGLKVKELILAVELEREYSKNDILTGYLNAAPYGGIEYGVQTASEDYFHVSAKDLTLPEAAMLAAIPKSPSVYSPYSGDFDQQGLLARQQYILDQMAAQGYITKQQATDAKKVDVLALVHPLQPKYQGIQAPYFVLAAKQELEDTFGASTVNRGGWKVITTLNLGLQQSAEQLVASNLPAVQRLTGGAADEEATVAEDVKTGEITALVGGVDFSNPQYGQNNYAAGILIPPGSSFKPYDYTTLINNNNNVGAGSVLYDTQGPLPGYPCTDKGIPKTDPNANCLWDYDFIYPGPEPLRYALGGSRNVPAVKAMLEAVPSDTSPGHTTSINKVISTATAMMDNPNIQGNSYNCYADEALTVTTQCYGASAIGDGAFLHLDDHVNGLATLARLGEAMPRTFLLKISDSNGKNVELPKRPETQVIKADSAFILDNMASDPNASYLPGSCSASNCSALAHGGYKFQRDNGSTFAVKTGTTNNGFDGLMTSWSSNFAVVSWVGNHQRNKNLSAFAGTPMETLTEPLTRGMMEAAQADSGYPAAHWTQPSDIKVLPAFILTKHIHYGDIEPSPSNDLFPSWYVQKSASSSSQTTDKVSGLIATSCTPDLAKQNGANSNANSWNVDIFVGGSTNTTSTASSSSGATDNVHHCDDQLPQASSPTQNGNCQAGSECTFTVTVTAGTHAFDDSQYPNFPGMVNLLVNGNQVSSGNITDSECTPDAETPSATCSLQMAYTPGSAGDVSVTAQVVDSVLYSATSDPTSVTVSSGSAISDVNGKFTGNTLSVSWSGNDSDNFSVSVSGPKSGSCTANGNTHCSMTFPPPSVPSGTYNITVTDLTAGGTGSGSVTK